MNLHCLHRSHPSWAKALALALALALLLLGGWGQVHRVLHPASAAAALLANPSATAHGPGPGSEQGSQHSHAGHHLGHESGSSLCLLVDHLADGTAITATLPLPVPFAASAEPPLPAWRAAPLQAPRPFDARAPPPLA